MIQCAHCALLYKSLSDEMGDRGADRIRVLNREHVYREFHSLVLLTFLHTFASFKLLDSDCMCMLYVTADL